MKYSNYFYWNLGKKIASLKDIHSNPCEYISNFCSYTFGNSDNFNRENVNYIKKFYLYFPIYLEKFNEISQKVSDFEKKGKKFYADDSYMNFLCLKGVLSSARKNKELMGLFKIVPISILTKEEYDEKQKASDTKSPSFDLVFGGFKQPYKDPNYKESDVTSKHSSEVGKLCKNVFNEEKGTTKKLTK